MSTILYGKPVAESVYQTVAQNIGVLQGKVLALVGTSSPAWQQYASSVVKSAEKIGVGVKNVALDENVAFDEFKTVLCELSRDENVAGILVEQPLPKHLAGVVDFVAPSKDVDCVTSDGVSRLYKGQASVCPATPTAVLSILDYYGIDLAGKNVVVIGRGNAVGKPLALMLLGRNATVTVCHSKSQNVAELTKRADVVVSACGVPSMVTSEYVSENAVVVDVGLSFVDGKTTGDVAPDTYEKCSAVTPVPGGVGPVTRACLFLNLIKLNVK